MPETLTILPSFLVDAHKQGLEIQKSLFDTGFEGLATTLDSQATILDAWTQSSYLPEASKALVGEWIRYAGGRRDAYKSLVDASFELARIHLDRLSGALAQPAS